MGPEWRRVRRRRRGLAALAGPRPLQGALPRGRRGRRRRWRRSWATGPGRGRSRRGRRARPGAARAPRHRQRGQRLGKARERAPLPEEARQPRPAFEEAERPEASPEPCERPAPPPQRPPAQVAQPAQRRAGRAPLAKSPAQGGGPPGAPCTSGTAPVRPWGESACHRPHRPLGTSHRSRAWRSLVASARVAARVRESLRPPVAVPLEGRFAALPVSGSTLAHPVGSQAAATHPRRGGRASAGSVAHP
jgi:hypothetical protein